MQQKAVYIEVSLCWVRSDQACQVLKGVQGTAPYLSMSWDRASTFVVDFFQLFSACRRAGACMYAFWRRHVCSLGVAFCTMIQLPDVVLQHIFAFLPGNAQAYAARLVNKASYNAFKSVRCIDPKTDVPLAVLQRMFRCCTVEDDASLLLACRAWAGDVDGCSWLRSQGCAWTEQACSSAAAAGQLEVLQWLRRQEPPAPWDSETCLAAAEAGHIEIVKWLRQQEPPVPWDEQVLAAAHQDLP